MNKLPSTPYPSPSSSPSPWRDASEKNAWTEDADHPIVLTLLGNLRKDAIIQVFRRKEPLGKFTSLRPATVSPFYCLNHMKTDADKPVYVIFSEILTTSAVERLEITKINNLLFHLTIPE